MRRYTTASMRLASWTTSDLTSSTRILTATGLNTKEPVQSPPLGLQAGNVGSPVAGKLGLSTREPPKNRCQGRETMAVMPPDYLT